MKIAEQLAQDTITPHGELPHKQLSNREFEVFTMLAAGKTITEIATQLHLSVKMQISSLADIVQYAVMHNLLPLMET